ncbi:hypothetical protein DPMN_146030 [Dreissena polymorpha]|uniref:Uncharacterized protein n=1 Tax=Dreissena polymorpha TaxID=45954 RepID=A0A9D4F5Y1_DREPO|nr:hypothetical protein DPMN_146030 [Dreissena polymorpha]
MINNVGTDIKLQSNRELIECLAECTDLGKITSPIGEQKNNVDLNMIVSIQDKSQYRVRTATDKEPCCITGIYEASNGDLVISDCNNRCVKLLNKAYTAIHQVQLSNFRNCGDC